MAETTPPIQPARTLDFIAAAGPREFTFPPAQQLLPGVKSYLNWPYAIVPGFRLLRLDVHLPTDTKGPLPVIVYAPGGSWLLAAKNHAPWKAVLAHGFAVVSIEYRLSGEAQFPTQLHDVKAAIRWTRANAERFGFDMGRVIGWGCSAGGFLISMAGATNGLEEFEGEVGEHPDQCSALTAVIAHYAPSDLATMADDTNGVARAVEPLDAATAPESRLIGFVPASRPDEAARFNVATYISSATVPFLLMHGDADTLLGIGQSNRLHAALVAVAADVEFHSVLGANHGGPQFEEAQVVETTLAFLRRVTGG
jgi:acetyl esterase/lipase